MCGIVGYIGRRSAQDVLATGLKRLEYRGYDSAGVVTLGEKTATPTLLRTKGKVAELEKSIDAHPTNDTVGIGHTRWATHGAPSKRNAHPQQVGDIFLVHNGIIENYAELARMLKSRGYEFKSDTDTEVLAALIDYIYHDTKNLREAVSGALQMVIGAYGIAVISTQSPDEIIVARKGSPLIVGIGDGETYIASDASALLGYTNKVIYLRDGEIGMCTRDGVDLQTIDSQAVDVVVETLEMDLEAIQKGGYDHFLLKEIMEQPDSLRATLSGRVVPSKNLVRLGGLNMTGAELRGVKHIFIVACGTASYAGMLAQYYYEELMDDVTVEVTVASELRYRRFNVPAGSLAIFVSQSGETADTLACLQEMKRRGVRSIGVVNAVGSTIAREVDGGVYLHAGAEISVASTKAYTSQVTALILIGLVMAQAKGLSAKLLHEYMTELDTLPSEIETTLATLDPEVKKIATHYTRYDNAIYLGRGELFPVSLEGALKLKEVSYLHTEAQAAGELKHGSIALLDDRFFEVFFVQENWLYDKSISNLSEINARKAHTIVVTDSDKRIGAERVVRIKTKLKHLTPLLFNLFSQLFAYYMSIERGNDVDQPRNLAKSVTVE